MHETEIIVIGAGGHAKVVIHLLTLMRRKIHCIVDSNPELIGEELSSIPIIGNDRELLKYPREKFRLVNAIGSVRIPEKRAEIFRKIKEYNFIFETLIHPTAIYPPDVEIGEGSQIMAGALLQPGCKIGRNVIINTGVIIDHDCQIHDHVHIAPGTVLSGGVEVGEESHLGTGAIIIHGIKIGRKCLIGAGATVIKDVSDGLRVLGTPAR